MKNTKYLLVVSAKSFINTMLEENAFDEAVIKPFYFDLEKMYEILSSRIKTKALLHMCLCVLTMGTFVENPHRSWQFLMPATKDVLRGESIKSLDNWFIDIKEYWPEMAQSGLYNTDDGEHILAHIYYDGRIDYSLGLL